MSTLVTSSNSNEQHTLADAVYAMPATASQARLWNLERTKGPASAWNIAVRFALSGRLDREKLEHALHRLTERHEALRTSFALVGDAVVQRIAARTTLPVEWCDLRDLDTVAQAEETLRLSQEHARQAFAMGSAPLFRVRLLRLRDDEHVMLWNAHPAVCDGWSVGLLAQDLMDAYGELPVVEPDAEEGSLDYGDYAVWLEQQSATPSYEAHRRYWSQRLRGWKVPALPVSWRNSSLTSPVAAIHSILLPRDMTDRLAVIANRHDATFFHAVAAAFAVAMRVQQETPEVVLGTPVSGRDRSELEKIVGTFVNYVPLRLRVEANEPFSRLLNAARDQIVESLDHAEYRSEDMLSDLAPGGVAIAEKRLFSTAFICQRDFVHPHSAGGVALKAIPSVSPGAVRPLTVFMVERAEGWRLSCEVDDRLVSAAAGRTLLEDFERVIAAIVWNDESSVAQLVLHAGLGDLPAARAEDALVPGIELERASRRIPATEFQRRFWRLDAKSPGRAALHVRIRLELSGALQVDALRAAIERVARQNEILRTTFQESDGELWQVIHAELPVDFKFLESADQDRAKPQSPEPGTDGTLLDGEADARFSLTEGPLFRARVRKLAPERHWLALTFSHGIVDGWSAGILLEQLQQAYAECVGGLPEGRDTETTPQFSAYTETERSLLSGPEKDRRIAWWEEHLRGVWQPLSLPRDHAGMGSTSGDDDARAGIEIVPLSPDAVLLARQIARDCQSTLFTVFGALFQALLFRYTGQRDILFLTPHANRSVDTESILGPMADPLCIAGHIDGGTSFRHLVEQFGLHSMDAIDNALPLNLVTPLMDLESSGGYHPLNQITFFYQRAFVHAMQWQGLRVQPLPDHPTVTGGEWQLGVVERDENIFLEFLYNAALYTPATIQTVCRHFSRLLIAAGAALDRPLSQLEILLPGEGSSASRTGSVLPAIERLLPQAALAEPHSPERVAASPTAERVPAAAAATAATASQTQQDILRIWKELFKIDDLSVESDFFDLGGHSLLLTRMQRMLKRDFGVRLTTADMYRNSTVLALSAWLERAQTAARLAAASAPAHAQVKNPRVIPIQPHGTARPLFVISQSMIFRTLASQLGQDQPVYALQMLDEEFTAMVETATFDEMIDFYVRLIREVQPTGPYRIAGWCVSGWIAYGIARRLEEDGERIELLMIMDVWAPGYWRWQPEPRRSLMLAIYSFQRLRALSGRLKRPDKSHRNVDAEHQPNGLRVVARNLAIWLLEKKSKQKTPLMEEMQRRTKLLEKIAVQAYRTGPVRGNLLLFRSVEEPKGPLLAPEMGWAELLARPANIELLPGTHHEIFELPGAGIMAERARAVLAASASIPSSAPSGNVAGQPGRTTTQSRGDAPLVEA